MNANTEVIPPHCNSSRYRSFGISLALVLLVCLTFGRVVGHPFLNWDDDVQILNNPDLNPVTWQGLWWNFGHTRMTVYMPVSYALWAAVAWLVPRAGEAEKLDPAWFHGLNVMLHALATVLLFFLLRRLTRHDVGAALGAAVFAVHPVQVEPVAWASGMYTLLSGVLSLAALVAFVRHAEQPATTQSRKAYGWSTAWYVLALLAKASSVVVPLVAALIDVLMIRKSLKRTLRDLLPWLLLIVPTLIVARHFETGSHVKGTPSWVRPLIATDAVYLYVLKVIAPWNLLVDNGQTPVWVWSTGRLYYTWLAAAALVAIALWNRQRRPWWAVAVGFFLFAVAPFSGLAKSNFQIFSTVADRYLYFALPGLALAVACWIARSRTRRPALVVGLLVIILAGRSYVQAGLWRDDETLFTYNQKHNPRSLISRLLLAIMYDKRGDATRSEALYAQVLAIEPLDPSINYNLGNFYLRQRRFADAAEHYQISIHEDPRGELAHSNLGVALAQMGRYDEAVASFRRALALSPRLYEAMASLGLAYELWDKPDEAQRWYEQAVRTRAGAPEAVHGLQRLKYRTTTKPTDG